MLDVARAAMPLDDERYGHVQHLAALTAGEVAAPDDEERIAKFAQFSRESLEHVVAATTGQRPAKGDMLFVIPRWADCFTHGLTSFDERLQELEAANPDIVP